MEHFPRLVESAVITVSKERDVTRSCILRADLHAYDMTYDCRSVLKHVLKCYNIFSDVHNNRKSCRGPVVSRCRMRQKSYRVNRPLGLSACAYTVFSAKLTA